MDERGHAHPPLKQLCLPAFQRIVAAALSASMHVCRWEWKWDVDVWLWECVVGEVRTLVSTHIAKRASGWVSGRTSTRAGE
jgi:hypothetical protein